MTKQRGFHYNIPLFLRTQTKAVDVYAESVGLGGRADRFSQHRLQIILNVWNRIDNPSKN